MILTMAKFKLLEIELSGFNRFKLTGTKYLKVSFTNPLQLILGTNGSGKSSFIEEASLLPADSSSFETGGYKRVTAEMDGMYYQCFSDFTSGSGKHNLYVYPQDPRVSTAGQEDLNPGKTQTVHREVVKNLFGITPAIHKLLTSRLSFCSLDAAKRKDWITEMSSQDYTYALELFNRLKAKLRDCTGALRLARKKLAAEIQAAPSAEELSELECRVSFLKRAVSNVLVAKTNQEGSGVSELEKKIARLKIAISNEGGLVEASMGRLLRLCDEHGFEVYTLANLKEELQGSIASTQALLSVSTQEFNQLRAQAERSGGSSLVDIEKLGSELKTLSEEAIGLKEKLIEYFDCNASYSQISSGINHIDRTTLSVLERMSSFKKQKLVHETTAGRTEALSKARAHASSRRESLERLNSDLQMLEHYKSHDETVCPQCQHRWIKGFDGAQYEKVKKAIPLIAERLKINEREIELLESEQSLVDTHFEDLQFFNNTRMALEPLDAYFALVQAGDYDYAKALRHFQKMQTLTASLKRHEELSAQIKDISHQLEIAQKADLKERERVLAQMAEREKEVQRLTISLHTLQTRLSGVRNVENTLAAITNASAKLQNALGELKHLESYARVHFQNKLLDELLGEFEQSLLDAERSLSQARGRAERIANYQSDIESLQADEKNYQVLCEQLSPTKGLIAESMLGSIHSLTEHINEFIATIWNYEFQIMPCSISSDDKVELDYIFPIKIKDNPPESDISKASNAQKEIINLAFRTAVMASFGLEDYPIFLDEFGSGFDTKHRRSMMDAIRDLSQSRDGQQVFIINHYTESYASLSNAEILALCTENIVIPPGSVFNRHAIFA